MCIDILWLTFLAQGDGPPPPSGQSINFIILGLLFAGMWFLIIAPQRKRQKEHQRLVSELKSGDEIITNGGIYGVITNVKDDRFVVKVADNTRIELAKTFVQARASGAAQGK